ncbi:unnamed protein product, partial [Vitis vinifera]
MSLVEDVNKKWKQVVLSTSPMTPLEHCEWLKKLLIEVWPNYMNPKFSKRFAAIVEKRVKHRKSRLIERVELKEFSLGSCPPNLGLNGTHWSTSGDQKIMHISFDWNTNEVSILLLAKLAKPLVGTARIVINSLHIKGDLVLMPVLNGKVIFYAFETTPEVRIGVAFGRGGKQTLSATELPGVSSWLVKLFTDTLDKTMVEPRRQCYSLPSVNLRKKAVGGILFVTVTSASILTGSNMKGSSSGRQGSSLMDATLEENNENKVLQTFIEVELGELTRRTYASPGSSPRWDTTFNMVLHGDTGNLKFHLYKSSPICVKYDFLTSSEIKLKYVDDDSTIFWAVGHGSSVLVKHAERIGEEVEMVVPFEGFNFGELRVKLVLKEWQFSDGSCKSNNSMCIASRQSLIGSPNFQSRTGRKVTITVMEGKDLSEKDKFGKCDSYVKLQYGRVLYRTSMIPHVLNPVWGQKFEFDELEGGEYLKLRCYCEYNFGDDNIGSARVNLEGLIEGSTRDVWIPLEEVESGELRLQIAVRNDDSQVSMVGTENGSIKLVIIEGKDLIAADIRGTSNPYVKVLYGKLKKKTKVIYKTLNPYWNQAFEFPDNSSPLVLHVKDHNALLPTLSIGNCVVEYQGLMPNQTADKWIPLQGVKRGEIHIQITRVPELQKKSSLDPKNSSSKGNQIYSQIRQTMAKVRASISDGDVEGVSLALSEIKSLEEVQDEYILQLEIENMLLQNKTGELSQEMFASSQAPSNN